MTAAIQLDELAKTYGQRPALAPTTLTVPAGQRVAIVGHNGSGKTTMLKLIAGLIEPSAGTATVHGSPCGAAAARAALSWISDTPVFYDDLSVREHIEFVVGMHGSAPMLDTDDLVETFGLAERVDDLPVTFSRGLRQKAAICIALSRGFETLMVDEPFVGLDERGKHALLTTFDRLHAGGSTLLVATHELGFVDRAQRLIALRDGEVIYDGVPADTDVHALVLSR